MANIYTNEDKKTFFLNDKNMTHQLTADGMVNPIPTLSLLNDVNDNLTQKIVEVKGDIGKLSCENSINDGGYILSSLSQVSGQVSYGTRKLVSADVEGLNQLISDTVNSLSSQNFSESNKFVRSIEEKNGVITATLDSVTSSDINGLLTKGQIEDLTSNLDDIATSCNSLCNEIKTRDEEIRSQYVKKSGDAIDHLSVSNQLTTQTFLAEQVFHDPEGKQLDRSVKIEAGSTGIVLSTSDSSRNINLYATDGLEGVKLNDKTAKSYLEETAASAYNAAEIYTKNLSSFNYVPKDGKILSALWQSEGKIYAKFKTLMSSDISCLSDYVNDTICTYDELSVKGQIQSAKENLSAYVNEKVSTAYKAQGSVSSYAELSEKSYNWKVLQEESAHIGEVWNVLSDDGPHHLSGCNYVWVNQEVEYGKPKVYGWDMIGGLFDFSKYYDKDATEARLQAVSNDIQTDVAETYVKIDGSVAMDKLSVNNNIFAKTIQISSTTYAEDTKDEIEHTIVAANEEGLKIDVFGDRKSKFPGISVQLDNSLNDIYVNATTLSAHITDAVVSRINDLDYQKTTAEAGKILNSIEQVDGKVSVDFRQLVSSDVSGLTDVVKSLSDDIEQIANNSIYTLKFNNHVHPEQPVHSIYPSVSAFFTEYKLVANDSNYAINGAVIDVELPDASVPLSVNDYGTVKIIENGNVIVVHDHQYKALVPLQRLHFYGDEGIKNVYILENGVSKRIFEEEISCCKSRDNYISSWISSNFENTGLSNDISTTIFNYDISAKANVTVDSNVLVKNDLSALNGIYSPDINCNNLTVADEYATGISVETLSTANLTADNAKIASAEIATVSSNASAFYLIDKPGSGKYDTLNSCIVCVELSIDQLSDESHVGDKNLSDWISSNFENTAASATTTIFRQDVKTEHNISAQTSAFYLTDSTYSTLSAFILSTETSIVSVNSNSIQRDNKICAWISSNFENIDKDADTIVLKRPLSTSHEICADCSSIYLADSTTYVTLGRFVLSTELSAKDLNAKIDNVESACNENIDYVSSWISSNFGNTAASATTTIFNYPISTSTDISSDASKMYFTDSKCSAYNTLCGFVESVELSVKNTNDNITSLKTNLKDQIYKTLTQISSLNDMDGYSTCISAVVKLVQCLSNVYYNCNNLKD